MAYLKNLSKYSLCGVELLHVKMRIALNLARCVVIKYTLIKVAIYILPNFYPINFNYESPGYPVCLVPWPIAPVGSDAL